MVALESSLITHGLPWPDNRDTALAAEAAVLAAGAVAATVAITRGRPVVGIDAVEIERFARAGDVAKASRRDLGVLAATCRDGATTVAGTMALAVLAGIAVMATGGIGGVHRGAERSFDVSADLNELARSDVAVVCSGAKAVLDLPKTLEVLETMGVPVIGYRTDRFPAFYVADSGLAVDARLDAPAAIGRVLAARRALKLRGGVVIANPPPPEVAIPAGEMAAWLAAAEAEAAAGRIGGSALTPFLLGRLVALSEGRTLAANRALVVANAALAGAIAVALAAVSRAG